MEEYYTLYNYTAKAVKAVDSTLVVGGPATCRLQYLPDFLAAAKTNGAPVDIVTSHACVPCAPPGLAPPAP